MTRISAARFWRAVAVVALCALAIGMSGCSRSGACGGEAAAPVAVEVTHHATAHDGGHGHGDHPVAVARTTEAPAPAGQAGLKIYLDADGNRITPTAEMLREEAATARPTRSVEGLEIKQHPQGGYYIRLDDRFMVSSKATVADDGRLVIECVPKQGEAAAKPAAHGGERHGGHGGGCGCCGGGKAHQDK